MVDSYPSAQETARRTGLSTGALAKRRYLKKAPTAESTSRQTPSSTRKVKWSDPFRVQDGQTCVLAPAYTVPQTERRRSPMNKYLVSSTTHGPASRTSPSTFRREDVQLPELEFNDEERVVFIGTLYRATAAKGELSYAPTQRSVVASRCRPHDMRGDEVRL
jgi:hypothetical protein